MVYSSLNFIEVVKVTVFSPTTHMIKSVGKSQLMSGVEIELLFTMYKEIGYGYNINSADY